MTAQTDSLKTKERLFRYTYENDFFSATDRYYTQGIYFELILPSFKKAIFSKTLIPLRHANINYYGINIERQGFTPVSISHEGIFYGERPFACVFYLSHSLISINTQKRIRLNTKLDLGIIGPMAKGEEEQKAIHKSLVNIQPLGWENQIANDYVVNYDLLYEKGVIEKKHLEIVGLAGCRAGTLYDDISGGVLIRAGWMNSYFENLGIVKHSQAKKKFRCTLFARGEVKIVGYNATMQGGVFNKKSIYTLPDSNITRVVATTSAGITISYKRLSLEYAKFYITPEFKNGVDHGWGHIVIFFCF